MFGTSKLLNINDATKRIGNFFKLPIQLFHGVPYPELAYIGYGYKLKSSQSPLFLKRDCEDSMLLSAIPGLVVEIDFFLGRVAEMDFPVNIFLSRYKRGLGQLLIIA